MSHLAAQTKHGRSPAPASLLPAEAPKWPRGWWILPMVTSGALIWWFTLRELLVLLSGY